MGSGYRFSIELFDAGGKSLGQQPFEPDFEPAEEWTRWRAVRSGGSPPWDQGGDVAVAPLWNDRFGEPYTSGFRVELPLRDGRLTREEFRSSYFLEQARRASARLVETGTLQPGDDFRYLVSAFPRTGQVAPGPPFRVESRVVAPELRAARLEEFLDRATPHGSLAEVDPPVFIPGRVLDEVAELAGASPDQETGGVLVGHLHRDARVPEVFAVVEAQLPATLAQGDATRLSFTAETWADLRARLELRRRQEVYCGWWHSHPTFSAAWQCRNCPLERRRKCPLAHDFFSTHDRALHRTVFPRAFHVGLVVNLLAEDETTFSLFGWRSGAVQSRGFHVLGERTATDAARPASADG